MVQYVKLRMAEITCAFDWSLCLGVDPQDPPSPHLSPGPLTSRFRISGEV